MSFTPPPPPPPPPGPTPSMPTSPPPPPSFQGFTGEMGTKPPRPQVRVGASLIVAGAIVHGVSVFLPWFKYDGKTLNGRDDFLTKDMKVLQAPGDFWLFFAAVLLGLGIALFAAGRNLAVAIIAVVAAVIALFFSLIGIGAASTTRDAVGGGNIAFGAVLGIIGTLIALAGAITALSKRRR